MKATGIVRRIDDLGRVVIPKEIRRTMRIREGDPIGSVIFYTREAGRKFGEMEMKTAEIAANFLAKQMEN